MRAHFVLRTRIIQGCILLAVMVLVGRLWIIQVERGEAFLERAERQYVRPAQALYDRGAIFMADRDERTVAAATVRSGFLLAMVPEQVEEPERAFALLSEHLELDRERFLSQASKVDDPYEEVARGIEPGMAEAIETLDLSGFQLIRDRWRYYPGGHLAARTIGFEAYGEDGLSRAGRYGLERYWEDTLKREEQSVYVNFFAEIFTNISDTLFTREKARAGDVVTYLEPSVQSYLEEQLSELDSAWDSKRSGGIVLDPMTGAVYALAVTPSFDLNAFSEADASQFGNPLVESVLEMGSIIKPISVAIGLDEGSITPQSVYHDRGFMVLDGLRINNFDGVGRGDVPMQEVLNQSLNTGVTYIMQEVGSTRFGERMLAFGLGEETGIDLPGEVPGLVANLSSPRQIEYATASFGQGIALTPIATVRALSALANGGTLITPHLARRIDFVGGGSQEVTFPPGERVLKEETSEEITRMLVEVVDDALRGGTVANPNYSIAAKTGTAQIARAAERGYYDDRYLHTFFGYFPAFEPRFLVFLFTEEPVGVRYASETLTTPFMNITDYLINYYDIPPDRTPESVSLAP